MMSMMPGGMQGGMQPIVSPPGRANQMGAQPRGAPPPNRMPSGGQQMGMGPYGGMGHKG